MHEDGDLLPHSREDLRPHTLYSCTQFQSHSGQDPHCNFWVMKSCSLICDCQCFVRDHNANFLFTICQNLRSIFHSFANTKARNRTQPWTRSQFLKLSYVSTFSSLSSVFQVAEYQEVFPPKLHTHFLFPPHELQLQFISDSAIYPREKQKVNCE
jgi:hypothetical protein